MTATVPVFTVIMATWGRGRHILPSITSVLQQDFPDFELIVVGDACTDATEAVVTGIKDPRARWINLPVRCGSQSAPNNAGIAAARGDVIAYLGHDDIWEPDHLGRFARLYRSDTAPDFAVSGAIFHLPNGLAGNQVHGLFGDDDDVRRFFFPPSSLSHRKAVIDRIGPWRMPLEIRPPVDEDLLLRASQAGLRFRSTGAVTVHKFAAGHRYLSYLQQESHEQADMLAAFSRPGHADRIAAIVQAARAGGTYMHGSERNFDKDEPGSFARNSWRVKGLTASPPKPLGRRVTIRHLAGHSMFDWEDVPKYGFRQSKANPRPRLALPVTGAEALLRFPVAQFGTRTMAPLEILCNGQRVTARPGWVLRLPSISVAIYRTRLQLQDARPSVLEFLLTDAQRPTATARGIAVGPIRLTPIKVP